MVGPQDGIPDLRWVNRRVPIADVAKALGLRFGQGGMIHCWHPEKHKNGDRTPSVGIQKAVNRVKCFGCGTRPMSVVDLVIDVCATEVAGAASWLEQNFEIRSMPKRRHLEPNQPLRWCQVGHEQPIELLVKSGIWPALSPQAQRIAPALLSLATKEERDTFRVRISNRGIMRYSGVRSFSSVSKGIRQLEEIEWLECLPSDALAGSVLRSVSTYRLTPYSDGLMELAQAMAAQSRKEIEAERELRKQQRRARRHALDAATRCVAMKPTDAPSAAGITRYKPLYSQRSVVQDSATQNEAPNVTGSFPHP
jgi:hypothetical protein